MAGEELRVHSLTEATLYLMIARCSSCAGGLEPGGAEPDGAAPGVLAIPVSCGDCGRTDTIRFQLSDLDPGDAAGGLTEWARLAESGQAPAINDTGEPSRVIDAAGWLTLHSMLLAVARSRADQAQSPAERTITRQLQIQAGQCLEEILKFYDADNDLPPEDAFFTDDGREQFRRHPELFLRTRVASMRAQSTIGRQGG